MKICHVLPFSPYRAGLYEAARDMIKADFLAGHEIIVIDAGITQDGKMVQEGKAGQIDKRPNFTLVTDEIDRIDEADIIIMHTGISDSLLVRNQTPLIWVVHGRPLACFRPESQGKGNSYSLYRNVSRWKRTKKMLYFWRQFENHWKPIFKEKSLCLYSPPIDSLPFANIEKHEFSVRGKYNFLLCDTDREDIDIYNTLIGFMRAGEKIEGLKLHIYALEFPLKDCYNILLGEMKERGLIGDLMPRVTYLNKVYNSADCLITPNSIITRTIGEAVQSELAIIANNPCSATRYTCDFNNSNELSDKIIEFCQDFNNNNVINDYGIIKTDMSLENYSRQMNLVYEEILEGG